MLNVTFKKMSIKSWQPSLLLEEIGVRYMRDCITSCYIEFSSYCIIFTTLLKHNTENKVDIKKSLKISMGQSWRFKKTCCLILLFENNIYKLHAFLLLLIKNRT